MKVEEKEKTVSEIKIKQNNSEIVTIKSKESKGKRDVSVDLIRIIACFSVICTHLCLQVLNQCYNRIDWSRLLEKSFLTEGVPLFFMITGFFLVNGRSYAKIVKNALKKVVLPAFVYILFAQIFYMFITNKQSIIWCLKNAFINSNFVGICKSIFTGDVTSINSLCAHLWYIYSYIKIIIWIPILWLVCKEEKNSILARRIILGFGILATIITDVQKFITIPQIGLINVFELVDREILYVLLGYELFVHKDKIKNNKKLCVISLIGFVLVNFARYKIEMQYMVINALTDIVGRENFMEWRYTCLNIFSGLFLFMSIYFFEIKSEKLSKIILWISDKTFGIYLIHYLILAKVDLYKFEKIEKIYFELLYLLVGLIVIFIASILIIVVLRKIKDILIFVAKKISMTIANKKDVVKD